MNNDPEHDPKLFAGKTRLYYGRWTYKYEQAARTGAAGAIIVHTTPSAGYGWQVVQTSWSGEQFERARGQRARSCRSRPGSPRTRRESSRSWPARTSTRCARRRSRRTSSRCRSASPGASRSRTRSAASRPRTCSAACRAATRSCRRTPSSTPRTTTTSACARAPRPATDAIYNGAKDNASGVAAMLSIAEAMRVLPRPKRSVVFAAVAAEEQGLLGAQYFAAHPTIAARPHGGQHQHRRHQHLRPHEGHHDDRARQVEPRRLGRRASRPRRAARREGGPVPRPRVLLPLGPVRARPHRRARPRTSTTASR